MIAPDLLKILVCPENHEPLTMADGHLISRLNEQIRAGTLLNRAGLNVTEPIDGGLVRKDGKYLYPVRRNIPIMLIDEALRLPA